MAQLNDVQEFIDSARNASTMSALNDLLSDITGEMGFDYYALMQRLDLRQHKRSEVVALENYPDCFAELFVASGLYVYDPVMLASERTNVGFLWSDVPKMLDLTSRQKWIIETGAREGLSTGFTVPAHVPGEASGSCSFAVRPEHDIPGKNLMMAQLVGSFAFEAARKIAIKNATDGIIKERPRLTTRQLECLTLVARGKTDWEIGQLLGIKEDTAREYIENARDRYGVKRRVQLVLRAVHDGHLGLNDILE
jgi:LuxR family quorum-sensing system transcriptional regulator CciR